MDFTDIRRLTIIALFADDELFDQLVLKGGNAISLVYGLGGRTSLDLDFSIDEDFKNPKTTEARIAATLAKTFRERGLVVFDGKFVPRPQAARPAVPWWGGYVYSFKLLSDSKRGHLGGDLETARRNAVVVGPGQQRIFSIDFSKYEYCAGKVEREFDDYTIYVYTPEMIVMEKLRAICQQMSEYAMKSHPTARARDFYDIHLLVTSADIDIAEPENLAVMKGIFAIKEVPLELLRRVPDYREFHRLDWPGVKDSVAGRVEDFEFYFDFVLGQIARVLEALGVE
jgi:hypothetical protein